MKLNLLGSFCLHETLRRLHLLSKRQTQGLFLRTPRGHRAKTAMYTIFLEKARVYTIGLERIRKILVSVNVFARNSGAGNGCANFMGAWKKCLLPAGKPSTPIKFLVLGGGILVFFLGGRGVPILFLWGEDFSETRSYTRDFPEELQGTPQPHLPLQHRPTRTPPPGPDPDPISTRF